MIDTELEFFNADEAMDAGLYDALKSGATKISGTYEMDNEGKLNFDQNNFVFKDKFGTLRVGRFKDNEEFLKFVAYCE